jgi:hypothetical protein
MMLIAALLAITTPVAAGRIEPVGDRIGFFYPPETFPTGTAFHIRHGWMQPATDEAIGVFDFVLEVDGVLLKEDIKLFAAESGDPDMLNRIWVYNFPDGMTGTHTFTGHWFAPCQYAVDSLGYAGPCATPNAKVETNTRTLTVNFLP